jgi:ice-binding like protein
MHLKPILVVGIFVLLATRGVAETPAGAAGPAPVGRGTAADYAVLGGSTVTNTGPTVLNGDLGLSPGTAITGFPPGIVNGSVHGTDAAALQAQNDLTTAYDDAAGRTSSEAISADLAGRTLPPGVYTSGSSMALTGTLTLDGQGDENAVFIFQAGSTLVTAPGSRVVLVGAAQACNVIWQVGSSATLETGSAFTGTILALTSITLENGTTVDGSTLARNGAVTLHNNVISRAACSGAPTSTTGTTATTVPGGGGGTTTTTAPDGIGVTTTTAPDGIGVTTTTGGRRTTASTIPNGATTTTTGSTTDTGVRPPIAGTGSGHSRGEALVGLALTGLGLTVLAGGRRVRRR